jgi:hypothetical protein
VTTHRIRFEGPSLLALQVATALADTDGIDLTASAPPTPLGEGRSALEVTLDGDPEVVAAAVAGLREDIGAEATLEVIEG